MANNSNNGQTTVPSTVQVGPENDKGTAAPSLALSEITASMATTTQSSQPLHRLVASGAMPTYKGQAQSVLHEAAAVHETNGHQNNTVAVAAAAAVTNGGTEYPIIEAIAYPEGQSQMLYLESGQAAETPQSQGHGTDGNASNPSTSLSASAGSHSKVPNKNNSNTSSSSSSRLCWIRGMILLGLLVVIASVVGGVCGGGGYCSSKNNNSNQSENETVTKTYFEDLAELQRAVDAYVNDVLLSNTSSSSSPETTSSSSTSVVQQYGPLSRWDVSRVTNFSSLFDGKRNPNLIATFDEDLSAWNVDQATEMFRMFAKLSKFTGRGLQHWNVRKVTTFRSMFHETIKFVGNVSSWDVSNSNSFTRMFSDCQYFNADITNWDTRNAENLDWMVRNHKLQSHPLHLPNRGNAHSLTLCAVSFCLLDRLSFSIVDSLIRIFRDGMCKSAKTLAKWYVALAAACSACGALLALTHAPRFCDLAGTVQFQKARVFNQNISSWIIQSAKDTTRMVSFQTIIRSA
jgi:surface protein